MLSGRSLALPASALLSAKRRPFQGTPIGEPGHLGMAELAMISADQIPGLPGAWRQQHGAGVRGFRLLPIAERVAGQAQTESDIGMVRVDAAGFVEQLTRPGVVAGAMAERP